MKRLYLAWQNPETRRWYPVGQLSRESGGYLFSYLHGARLAQRDGAFHALPSFPDLDVAYESRELFPLFSNRLLRRSRPDYQTFLAWLGISADDEQDPMELLAMSGGSRVTDSLEVFAPPERSPDGAYSVRFFVHGLRHMPPASIERADCLVPGDRLLAMRDFQNPFDGRAVALRTAESAPGDMHLIGYCPRFLFADTYEYLVRDADSPLISVERVNPQPAPSRFRLLCKAEFRLDSPVEPFSTELFQALVADLTPAAG